MFGKGDQSGRTKLLIVDDDEKFVRLLSDYLGPFGYQIETAKQMHKAEPAPVSVGGLWIDPGTHTATLDDQPLSLTPVEYDMLLALARSAGRVKSREQLLLEIAERDFEAFDRSIDVHISSLRKKLGDDPKSPRYIETVRGAGYRMRTHESEPLACI